MPRILDGRNADVADDRFAIVVSRYNAAITEKILQAAVATLIAGGVDDENIDVAYVPGAFEIPMTASRLAHSGEYAAVLCLGAVIQGETTHDQYINRAVSHFLAEISVTSQVPVLFGVLTCQSLEQAIHRAGGNKGNKGAECAAAALEMVGLMKQLPEE